VRTVAQFPLLATIRLPSIRVEVDRDVKRWIQPRLDLPLPETCSTVELARAMRHRPLRSVIYARLGNASALQQVIGRALRIVYRGEPAFEIRCERIGAGLLVLHGFATIVIAAEIGVDCQLSQQVTIGYSDAGGPPTLGDRVRVGANAVVIGPLHIGDDSVVGAGAVVVHDVASGTVVGGVPARVIPNATNRFAAVTHER
jgi:serine O-acetyltransferase